MLEASAQSHVSKCSQICGYIGHIIGEKEKEEKRIL